HRAQAAVGTNADDGAAIFRNGGKLLDGLAQDARTGGGEGMAGPTAAAVRVHPSARKAPERVLDAGLVADKIFVLEPLDVAQHLRRKRFVNFPQRNVIELEPVSR